MSYAIAIAIIGSLLVCYFSTCNIVLKTLSRKRLTDRLGAGYDPIQLDRFIQRQPMLLLMTGTLRAVLNLVVTFAILYRIEEKLDGQWPLLMIYLVTFLIAGVVLSIFAVAIPVSWARYQRESLVAVSMPLLNTMLFVFRPIVWSLHLFDPIIRRISGIDLNEEEDDLSEEVLSMVEHHEDGAEVDEAQKEMIEAVFDLSDTDAEQVMTPRTDVKGIEVNASLDQIKDTILQHGHSRIPVYEETIDNIVGILYAKDMIKFIGDGEDFDLRSVLREAMMVPESKNVGELLAEFKAKKIHIALVLDEYGGTAGLVTIEDILEELVGEIQDEYEVVDDTPQIERIDAETLHVDARVEIDDLNDELDVELPEDEDYDTVGGFVFATLGHIPKAGETFEYEGVCFKVTEAERTRVVRVEVKTQPSEKTAAE